MKRIIITILLALAVITATAQTTNPLNYSGQMYIEAIEIFNTPRYISYEDHAILTRSMYIPSTQNCVFESDFEKGVITIDSQEMKVKVDSTKRYDHDYSWEVVVYMHLQNSGDPAELVWKEFGQPFFQQISKDEKGKGICRFRLSPHATIPTETDLLKEYFQGY
ncbi:MAG: hypothetical protein K6E37_06625 [Bacteroidales bacterium]|nr:hypothetical protein [Bacteroidales bacterium]